jgi:hypothetical protein
MGFFRLSIGLLLCLPAVPQTPDGNPRIMARMMSQPPLSPEDVAAAEARLFQHPDDLDLRLRLLTHYRDMAPAPGYDDPVKRSARLRHVVYVIEHHANVVDSASPLVYVPRKNAAYANESDHEVVRNLWLRLADTNPADQRIVLSAAWFLFVEDKLQAADFLRRAGERQPDTQRIAANLGFMYGMQILGLDRWAVDFDGSPSAERSQAKQRAITELDNSSNPAVIAGAATAIPNLAMRASRGGQVDPELFQLSSRLMAKARTLAPSDAGLQGPMPMIEYFQENQRLATDRYLSGRARGQGDVMGMDSADSQRLPNIPANRVSGAGGRPSFGGDKEIDYIDQEPSTAPMTPSRVRVGWSVQKLKLISAPAPRYSGDATAISGQVLFHAIIAADGTVSALDLRSGHPLVVQPAIEAVRQWRFQPTLLNGKPVEVMTDIVVLFPPVK